MSVMYIISTNPLHLLDMFASHMFLLCKIPVRWLGCASNVAMSDRSSAVTIVCHPPVCFACQWCSTSSMESRNLQRVAGGEG